MAETVGFIGLGQMGEPIAANLLNAGYGLRVYNRTASKAAGLAAKGARAMTSSAETATAGGIVLTMLANDQVLEEICLARDSFVERLGAGGIHISLSTIAPATARKLAEHHARHGVEYVAAPVFGRPEAAAAKRLWVCVSGSSAARKRVHAILAAISQGIFDFGEDAGAANVVKLCGNFLIASAIEAMAESFALAEKNGINKREVLEMIGKTFFACPIYQSYGKIIVEERFEPAGFRLALALKDINLALQTAASSSMPMPLASLVRDHLLEGAAKGRENMDWTVVALGVAEDAGIK
jgi:3-hydroxyisobutyrate dehydrogenase-like beta-hydroxyacid dehydrogenase